MAHADLAAVVPTRRRLKREIMLHLPEQPDHAILGQTLAEFAAARGKHPQFFKKTYAHMMRTAEGIALPPITRQHDDGGTVKFCLPVGDYNGKSLETESVIIPMLSYKGPSWFSLCISSQVGCRMACSFCETARMGLLKNLSAAEIVQQRIVARELRLAQFAAENKPLERPRYCYFVDGIQNIVFMGMGEPLDNFDNVTQAIRVLSDPSGLAFPMSQICVSTVGRIDGLNKLAALNWPNLRIAISLNAPNDKLRDELMPINKGMPLKDLQRTLIEYPMSPRGRYMIEYVLIKGVNDSLADAEAVADFCRPLRCIVNLIPYNPQRGASFETPAHETVLAFMERLKSHKIFTKRRITKGRDLMSACGQLGNPEVRRQKPNPRLPVLPTV